MSDSDPQSGLRELRTLPFAEVRSGRKLIDVLTWKLQLLDSHKFQDQLLEGRVRLLLDLLTESFGDRYQNLSILAFAHIIVAIDYFLRVNDNLPDVLANGYSDDLKVVQEVFTEFKDELDAFKEWRARQPKDDVF